jgi:histone H3/H4
MENIIIPVDAETAKAYRAFEPRKQREIQIMIDRLIKSMTEDRSLEDVIQEMQKQAKENGLTQEILDRILEDE